MKIFNAIKSWRCLPKLRGKEDQKRERSFGSICGICSSAYTSMFFFFFPIARTLVQEKQPLSYVTAHLALAHVESVDHHQHKSLVFFVCFFFTNRTFVHLFSLLKAYIFFFYLLNHLIYLNSFKKCTFFSQSLLCQSFSPPMQ